MEEFSLRIGEKLREIRTARQLTLEDVAKQTGVSKPMLGQIERGQSVPTISTLWKIATGLKVPLSTLCRQRERAFTVAEPQAQSMISEEGGAMRAYPLFPYDPARGVEIFYIEFDAGVDHCSEPHAAGVEEYVFVVRGELRMTIGEGTVELRAGQSLRFQADERHAYGNPGEERCCVYDMIFYLNQ